MGTVVWVCVFLVLSGVCAWIALGNGAETVLGLAAAFLLGADVRSWSDRGIRIFVGLTWVGLTLWFVLGLFEPALRP